MLLTKTKQHILIFPEGVYDDIILIGTPVQRSTEHLLFRVDKSSTRVFHRYLHQQHISDDV